MPGLGTTWVPREGSASAVDERDRVFCSKAVVGLHLLLHMKGLAPHETETSTSNRVLGFLMCWAKNSPV